MSEERIERIERNLETVTERLDSQIQLMAELRVGQVVLNQQLTQTQRQLGETNQQLALTDAAVSHLVGALERILPVIQIQQQQLAEQNQRIDEHSRRIEDLYRSQGHILRRLFGESDEGQSP
ncbi:hypothetical protein [Gloeobacter kilaueensis]|uniref:Uncharacterized protein n=1 Tax=Gloeobacter kilaueensis (strain ATCC BAA-2537 / CCAP 1431/1 / ULC 316 / JS1) TaxID=1183438 RepID=U5QRT4_GLOK1|nr:hypothetical protein [Gloeobacter kilaueensis]AGY60400.1 hypothetical protein GKIL_4154 [Gloeobacter kilaueensis JS1]